MMVAPLFTLFRQSAVHSDPGVLRASARQDGPPAPAGGLRIALLAPARGDGQGLRGRLARTGQEAGIEVAAHREGKLAVEAEIRAGLGLPPVLAMEGR